MWTYDRKLQYPVKIKTPNHNLASIIISQLGGPDGELAASMRYLNQRYSMPYGEVTGILTDVGTEELAHLEMVGAILYQLTRDLSPDEIAGTPFATYFVDHTVGVYPVSASGQKARVTYDNIIRLCDDPDVLDPIRYLREREIVHYQRFGDALRIATDHMNEKNFYAINPSYDQ